MEQVVDASDNELLKRVPWSLGPGQWIQIGEARIERAGNGDIRACDPYGCAEARVPPEKPVMAAPIPAIHRLLPATPYIYVEFEKRVLVEDGEDYWTLAPYEIEVYAGNLVLVRLSPVRVKYTLVGDVVDGTLARYYRSVVAYDQEELPDPVGTAVVRMVVRGGNVLLPGVGFNASISTFYVDDDGIVYYPQLQVEAEGSIVTARNTNDPPKRGLREIVRVGAGKRMLPTLLQQIQPFTMKVEVVRRSLTTP